MTRSNLKRIALVGAVTLGVASAAAGAFAEDKELLEATQFTGTIAFLSAKVPGFIFGAVRNGGTAFAGFGETRDGNGKTPDENSIFRIASVSKVFCGAALGSLIINGTVGLADPLQAHVEPGVTVPEFGLATYKVFPSGVIAFAPRTDSACTLPTWIGLPGVLVAVAIGVTVLPPMT